MQEQNRIAMLTAAAPGRKATRRARPTSSIPHFSDTIPRVPSNSSTSVVVKIEQSTDVFEVSQPALSDLLTDYNTLKNRDIPAPIWACLDDGYREMLGILPASPRPALPPSVSLPLNDPYDRHGFLSEGAEVLTSSGGDNTFRADDGRPLRRVPQVRAQDWPSDEEEADDLARAISADSFATLKVHAAKFNSRRRERKQPDGSSASQFAPEPQARANAAASRLPRPAVNSPKEVLRTEQVRKGTYRRSASSSSVGSSISSSSVASGATDMTNARTASSTSLNSDDGSLQVAAPGPSAGSLAEIKASMAQKRAARPSALTLATMEAAERVEQARTARSNELEHIEKWDNAMRQLHGQQDRIVMATIEKMRAVGWGETSAGRIMMTESEYSPLTIGIQNVCEGTSSIEEIEE